MFGFHNVAVVIHDLAAAAKDRLAMLAKTEGCPLQHYFLQTEAVKELTLKQLAWKQSRKDGYDTKDSACRTQVCQNQFSTDASGSSKATTASETRYKQILSDRISHMGNREIPCNLAKHT